MSEKIKICPQCGNKIPVIDGYVTWCDKCNWNIDPKQKKKKNIFDFIYSSVGNKSAKDLYNKVLGETVLGHKLGGMRILAYILSITIHILTVFCAYIFIYSLFNFSNFGDLLKILLFGFLTFMLRPRVYKVKTKFTERRKAPNIYDLVDKISEKLNAPKVDCVAINDEFNASFVQSGVSGKRVLTIGLPLFSILDNEERVALIGHELAHNVNNDCSRGFLMRTALNTISTWYYIVCPPRRHEDWGYFFYIFDKLRVLLSKVVLSIWYLLGMVVYRQKQRAEYYADYLASKVSGTDAKVSLLRKLHFAPIFYSTIEKVCSYSYTSDIFGEFRNRMDNIPERESLRISRLQESETAVIDSSHPPTLFRINYLKHNYVNEPLVVLSEYEKIKLENEINELERQMNKILIDKYREYYI